MKKFTEEHLKEIINKQMEINWYSERYEDLQLIDSWYTKFTTTEEKEKEWKNWLKIYLKPFCPHWRIMKEVGWITLEYWLKTI